MLKTTSVVLFTIFLISIIIPLSENLFLFLYNYDSFIENSNYETHEYISSVIISLLLSIVFSFLSILFSLYLAFNLKKGTFQKVIFVSILFIFLYPSVLYSYGIIEIQHLLTGSKKANFLTHSLGMITYLAPFSIAFILVSTQKTPKYYSYLAKEIGFSRLNEFRYIFLPISLPAITSVLILNILFSLNETSRTYILGNYYDPISLKILGTLNSGANGFTYSIGIFFIIITIILIIPVLMLLKNKSTPQIN